jgi:hypothetical protein
LQHLKGQNMARSQRAQAILTAALGAPGADNSNPFWQLHQPGLIFLTPPQRAQNPAPAPQDPSQDVMTEPGGFRRAISSLDENPAPAPSGEGAPLAEQPGNAKGSGPWEKYAKAPQSGPWQKYAQAATPDSMASKMEVELPDGTIAEFPDGTPHDVIKSALQKWSAKNQAQASAAGPDSMAPQPSTFTRAAREQEYSPEQMADAEREADISNRARIASANYGFSDAVAKHGTFSFADEIFGGLMAPIDMGVRAIQGKPSLGLSETYSRIAEAEKRAQENYAEKNPGADLGAAILSLPMLGAPFKPKGGGAPPVPLGKQIVETAGKGAAAGGVYGFGEGRTLDERATGAMNGAAVGGTVGVIAPPLMEKVITPVAKAIARPFTGLINPEKQAAKDIAGAFARDEARGSAGLTDEAYAAAQREGQSPALADKGGETVRALARYSSNVSPEARDALLKASDGRFETQAPRAADFVQRLFGGDADASKISDTLAKRAKAVNNPAYEAAHKAGETANLWTKELADLAQAPDIMDAIKSVSRTAQNKSVIEGYKPIRNPFTMAKDGNLKLKMTLRADGTVEPISPNLAFWDTVKEGLDRQIETLFSAGKKRAANDTVALKNRLLAELDRAIPEYKTARAGAASFFGAEDALEAGQKFVKATSSISIPDAQKALAKMSASERGLFAQGFASELSHAILSTPDRRNVLNQLFLNNPNARARITLALGPKRADQLEAYLRREAIMDSLRQAVSGNSSTASQLAQMAIFGGGGTGVGYLATGDMTKAQMIGAMIAGAKYGKVKIDANVAKVVGAKLASNDPKVLDKAVRMVAGSKLYMNALRSAEEAASRVGGIVGSDARIITPPAYVFGNENNQQKENPRYRP